MNALQRWQARSKEQGRLFRALPGDVQDRFLREEWRIAWWSWLTIAVPILVLSLIVAIVVVALAVFFGAVYDPANPEMGMAGASEISGAVPDMVADGLDLVIYGPIYVFTWAPLSALSAHASKVSWTRRWHRENKTGLVPDVEPPSFLVAKMQAWWRALPKE